MFNFGVWLSHAYFEEMMSGRKSLFSKQRTCLLNRSFLSGFYGLIQINAHDVRKISSDMEQVPGNGTGSSFWRHEEGGPMDMRSVLCSKMSALFVGQTRDPCV